MSDDYRKPFDELDEMKDQKVLVHRVRRPKVVGELHAFDKHINLALTDVKVHSNEPRNKESMFVKGSGVVSVEPVGDSNE